MKKIMQICTRVALFAILAVTILSFTSCEKEDDKQTIYYSMGFDSFSSSGMNFLTEMRTIENAFKTALAVTDSHFSIEGSMTECDSKVKKACAAAEATIKDKTFSATFDFVVTNINSGEAIYTFKYTVK